MSFVCAKKGRFNDLPFFLFLIYERMTAASYHS